jgi:hypothetical protein
MPTGPSFLDADQLVVLGQPVGARQRAGLDLPAIGGHGEVGDGGVLGLAGAVGHDGRCSGADAPSTASSVSVSVPIWLTLTRIELARAFLDPLGQARGVGHEQVVAHQLARGRRWLGQRFQPSQSSSAMPSSIEMIG